MLLDQFAPLLLQIYFILRNNGQFRGVMHAIAEKE
jgi:hypothetical protein